MKTSAATLSALALDLPPEGGHTGDLAGSTSHEAGSSGFASPNIRSDALPLEAPHRAPPPLLGFEGSAAAVAQRVGEGCHAVARRVGEGRRAAALRVGKCAARWGEDALRREGVKEGPRERKEAGHRRALGEDGGRAPPC